MGRIVIEKSVFRQPEKSFVFRSYAIAYAYACFYYCDLFLYVQKIKK
ncbi:MAG: hypothetical protein IJ881_02755 [Neisseriaceae bacterium]|nr:hypothetical protein [Neisseriaceae bacterium]MBR3424480.1 hypothetical protein [Neisseriaceae bacterium]